MKKFIQLLIATALASSFSQTLLAADNQNLTSASSLSSSSSPSSSSSMGATGESSSTTKSVNQHVISMSTLVQQLQKAGYIIKSLDFSKDNNQYSADVVDHHGDKQSLTIDATKGLTADQKKMPHEMPLPQIIKKYEKNGAYVKSISTDGKTYKITTVDNKGNEQDNTVDVQSGKPQL